MSGPASFINKVTRADVDVQPSSTRRASSTTRLNTIEMQSITALAHLGSCVMDLSEQCGYTVEVQCKLFHSIKLLSNGKPIMLAVWWFTHPLQDVGEMRLFLTPPPPVIPGPAARCVRRAPLAHRVDGKVKGSKITRTHVAQPKPRDDVLRAPRIPETTKARKKCDRNDPEWRSCVTSKPPRAALAYTTLVSGRYTCLCPAARAGLFAKNYLLANAEWKMDVIPEIMDGKLRDMRASLGCTSRRHALRGTRAPGRKARALRTRRGVPLRRCTRVVSVALGGGRSVGFVA
ncbi:hypothetical protein GGX14DRAFT_602672 [Mycena pura]|uniref:Uncharacterized protein n=1 Tax=Mycena pura TaxID=153505 RepID=A0AAD6VME3_9AGAR|nr:hypothetical protein GGX14DRAFT_602672 [Mycena pura]